MDTTPLATGTRDILIHIRGTVQGVGFRPFIARLAARHSISGWVRNDDRGVTILARQTESILDSFTESIRTESPPASRIDQFRVEEVTTGPIGKQTCEIQSGEFHINESPQTEGSPMASVTPDLATCPACREELLDPANRRHRYPFINCTDCGPRYTIINSLPYDRERTTMLAFTMCPPCNKEYLNPLNRRYHAQPNACPDCGPELFLKDMNGELLSKGEMALAYTRDALAAGEIVAIKGLGGFHLFVDACHSDTVERLRVRKHRDKKPFAVMFPDLDCLRTHAHVSEDEETLLSSPAAPIVLVKRRASSTLSTQIAPDNPWIGAILPYTPLHILLMDVFKGPLVATSANLSEEPLCSGNEEALTRLNEIADFVLMHDRAIARQVDDSVQRVARHGPILLRRARGYAPTPLLLPEGIRCERPLLSLGGHLKNTVAIAMDNQVVASPHIGDLSNIESVNAFHKTIDLLVSLYGGSVAKVICDLHPDYISTQVAESMELPVIRVQHHLAHILACLLEHGGGPDTVLGVAWDGTGYGEDGTIWGGEFILVDRAQGTARRVAHLKPFPLPGGEVAVRQTARSALGALHAANLMGDKNALVTLMRALRHDSIHVPLFMKAIEQRVNAPLTSSAGRLFDTAAALLDLVQSNTFEGQAGMAMEFAAEKAKSDASAFPWDLNESPHQPGALEVDWSPMLKELCVSAQAGADSNELSMRFHKTLAAMILKVAQSIGIETIVLTGGCFQNAILSDLTTDLLQNSNFNVLLHHELSPNDNSISAGQAFAALLNITRVQT